MGTDVHMVNCWDYISSLFPLGESINDEGSRRRRDLQQKDDIQSQHAERKDQGEPLELRAVQSVSGVTKENSQLACDLDDDATNLLGHMPVTKWLREDYLATIAAANANPSVCSRLSTACSSDDSVVLSASTDLQSQSDSSAQHASGPQRRADTSGTRLGTGVKPDDRMERWLAREQRRQRLREARAKLGFGGRIDGRKYTSTSSEYDIEQMLDSNGLLVSLHGILGAGSFSRVYRATWTPEKTADKIDVALKILKGRQSRPLVQEDGSLSLPACLRREVQLVDLALDHPNLVRVLHSSVSRLPYAVVLECCAGGDLHSYINEAIDSSLRRLGWAQRLKIADDIAAGMAYLHSQNIVHRDLKSHNILLDQPVQTLEDAVHAKVCDFAEAKLLGAQHSSECMTRGVGSWMFMAPEVFEATCSDQYTEKVDVYSYAMVIYRMLAGSYLEQQFAPLRFVIFASRGGRPDEHVIPDSAPLVLKRLMRCCWDGDATARPSFSEITMELCRGLEKATDV
eukprot:TRINITY_DN7846_c0_g1_i1.p1 TRINITY_DN7846_c0_g1~~TRINITY_DN7846_c0_g1_i1.p1  ORF type:complete len:513 (+),score=67.46 TRINITY_DN7846_c0_g1_i1:69-1607(+)